MNYNIVPEKGGGFRVDYKQTTTEPIEIDYAEIARLKKEDIRAMKIDNMHKFIERHCAFWFWFIGFVGIAVLIAMSVKGSMS